MTINVYEMPPAIKGRRRRIPALGHHFVANLTCECGTEWRDHQACPLPCTHNHRLRAFKAGSLSAMCRAGYVTNNQISDVSGYSRETVSRVMRGDLCVDFDTRAWILQHARELLDERTKGLQAQ